jgi:hypothetical protein
MEGTIMFPSHRLERGEPRFPSPEFLSQFTTGELLMALGAFLNCLQTPGQPNDEETAAIAALLAEVEQRRAGDSFLFVASC